MSKVDDDWEECIQCGLQMPFIYKKTKLCSICTNIIDNKQRGILEYINDKGNK